MREPPGWPYTAPEPSTGDPCDTGPCDLCLPDGSLCPCRCHVEGRKQRIGRAATIPLAQLEALAEVVKTWDQEDWR